MLEHLITSICFLLWLRCPVLADFHFSFYKLSLHPLCTHANMLTIQEFFLQLPICQSAITTIAPWVSPRLPAHPPVCICASFNLAFKPLAWWTANDPWQVKKLARCGRLHLELEVRLRWFDVAFVSFAHRCLHYMCIRRKRRWRLPVCSSESLRKGGMGLGV